MDLRLINQFIAARLFRYQRLAGFLASVLPNEHLISWDVKDAFYHVRIFPAHRKYFRFVVDGVVYEPRVLPFGMRLSPWAWTKVLRPVVAALRLKGFHVLAYVDDFAATGRGRRPSSAASATAGRFEIVQLFQHLGVHVNATKGVSEGTTRLPILGFLADTQRRLLLLPKSRLDKIINCAKALLSAANAGNRRVSARPCLGLRARRCRAPWRCRRHGSTCGAFTTRSTSTQAPRVSATGQSETWGGSRRCARRRGWGGHCGPATWARSPRTLHRGGGAATRGTCCRRLASSVFQTRTSTSTSRRSVPCASA